MRARLLLAALALLPWIGAAANPPPGAMPALVLAQAAPPQAQPDSDQPPERNSGSWWWSWGDGVFGLTFGGVTYGSGHGRVEGSDKLVHVLRPASGFHGIELRGPVDIVIKQGSVENVTLHADDNVAPLIETSVADGILRIGVVPGAAFRTKHRVGATVDVKSIDSLKVLGSGDVTCAQLDGELLEVTIRGSGDVRFDNLHASTLAVLVQGSGDIQLAGAAAKQGFVIEGSGDVNAAELNGREVAVRIAGSGDAKVWAIEALSVDIAGSGDVVYRGQPALTKSVHGSGDIIHR